MTIHPKLWPWIIVAGLVLFALYAISGILLPFIAGLFVAYALNPAVSAMGKWKIPRSLATAMMVFGFFIIFAGLLFFAMPFLKTELVLLATALPHY